MQSQTTEDDKRRAEYLSFFFRIKKLQSLIQGWQHIF